MSVQQLQEVAERVIALESELATARQEAAEAKQRAAAAEVLAGGSTGAAGSQTQWTGATPQNPAVPGAMGWNVIGKPDTFDGLGNAQKWRDWSLILRSYVGTLNPKALELMHWAEMEATPAWNAKLQQNGKEASRQVFYWLLQTCRGSALTIVSNAGQYEGMEAWRQLQLRYEPKIRSRYANQLVNLMSWNFEGDVLAKIDQWEREVANYEAAAKEEIGDNIKIGLVLLRLPESAIKQHLVMNAERLQAWGEFKEELVNIRRVQELTTGGPQPMEIGALGKSKGKGKSKNLQLKPNDKCYACGKAGHMAKDCWHKDGGKDKGQNQGRGKSSGKYSKGKSGKGQGAAQGQEKGKGVLCYKCGGRGHIAKDCANKAVHSLEPTSGITEPAAEPANKSLGAFFLNALSPTAGRLGEPRNSNVASDTETKEKLTGEFLIGQGINRETVEKLVELGVVNRGGPRRITMGLDSGAAVSVVPRGTIPDYPIEENEDSRAGRTYRTANGAEICDEGTQKLVGRMIGKGGTSIDKGLKVRVCRVEKGLAAVSEIVDAGHTVVFGKHRSFIRNESTGEELEVARRNKIFEFDMEVLPFAEARHRLDYQSGFGRQAGP